MSHDQLFKQLLQSFFYDFLSLFLPDLAVAVDPDSITFEPAEVFTDIPEGEQRTADLVARVRTLEGTPELILVHTEVERRRGPEFADRMWEYNVLLQLREKLPVLSVAVQLRSGTPGLSLETYRQTLFGVTYRSLEYWQVGLRDLEATAYAHAVPVLAAALSALMQPGSEERGMLKFTLAQRIAASGLDEARVFLLLNIVETYLDLSEAEHAAYQALLATEGGAAVEILEETWADRKMREGREQGIVQGIVEGQRALLRRLVLTRFGTVPEQLEQRIAHADSAALEVLQDRVVVARDLDEVLTAS